MSLGHPMTRPPGPRSPAGASRGSPPAGSGVAGEPGHLLSEPPDVVEVVTGSVPDTGRRMRCCAGRGARFVPRGPEQWRRGRGAKRRAHFAQRPVRLPRLRQGCEPANEGHARQRTGRMSSPNSAISALGRGPRHVVRTGDSRTDEPTMAARSGWWHPVGPRTTGMLSPRAHVPRSTSAKQGDARRTGGKCRRASDAAYVALGAAALRCPDADPPAGRRFGRSFRAPRCC